MLIRCKYLFIVLFAIQICIGCSYAGQDAAGPCTTSADCNPGLWCEEYTNGPTTFKQCSECQNHPSEVSECSKTETTNPGTCYYTDHGGTDQNSCPWTMNCPDKPNFGHGTWEPDEPTITYSGTGTAPECSYTDPETKVTCDDGYYFSTTDNNCVQCDREQRPNNNNARNVAWTGPGLIDQKFSCPWKATCTSGSIFNETSYNCTSCDSNYEYIGGDFEVHYDSSNYTYWQNGTQIDAPQCVGKWYQVKFDKGTMSNATSPNPNPIYEQYGEGFYLNRNDTSNLVSSVDAITSSRNFSGYFYGDGANPTQIFDSYGALLQDVDFKLTPSSYLNFIKLTAQWSNQAREYSLIIKNGNSELFSKTCSSGDGACDLSEILGACNTDGYKISETEKTYSHGKLKRNGDIVTFTPNNAQYPSRIEINITNPNMIETCPSGYYCKSCKEKPCPYGSKTSSTGSTSVNECHYPAGTTFSDSRGNFNLPSNIRADLSQTVKNPQQN